MDKVMRVGRELLLWAGGALGALCLLFLAAGWLFNVTPLVFASGSMSPAYDAGALGIAREVPAQDVAVGDVVSVRDADGARVTHRVVDMQEQSGTTVLTLKGDTNDVVDAQTYTVTSVDRVSFGVPYAGRALSLASSPAGLLLGGLLVAGSLWLGFGRRDDAARRSSRRTRALLPAGVVSAIAVGGVLGATGAAPWAFTSAVWSDTATATTIATTSVAADAIPPVLQNPVPANGASGVGWAAIDCSSGVNQICVDATDSGGSGIATVRVALVRTSGTVQCWNGSGFVNGTACLAQPMTPAAGNQYRTSGLTDTAMAAGTYQATFTASDLAGNAAAPVVASFTVTAPQAPAAPTLVGCVNTANGSAPYRLSWTWPGPGDPDSFAVVYSVNPGGARVTTFPGSARTGLTVDINNEGGSFRLVAVSGGVQSVVSNQASYSGNGGSKSCTVVP